ncbi:MAG: alanine racemase, partial [Lactococcus lactis]|nr:alanine racemase [Lactococcus lactis]
MKTSPHRNTSAIVDLKAIRNNIEKFKKHIHPNAEIWPAVKADAYGHGSVEVS